MDAFQKLLDISPAALREILERADLTGVEELRLRLDRAIAVTADGTEQKLTGMVTPELIRAFLEKATGASLHSFGENMANGFIPCEGLRIGICGEAIIRNGHISGFRAISSLAVRLPAEHRGCCDGVYDALRDDGGGILIVSPPGAGKTTALRELIRRLSDDGYRIAVADERNEISASCLGQPGFELGEHVDVMVGAPKAEAAIRLLRGMTPEVIAMDEISSVEDMRAAEEICGCGVKLLASCHGRDGEDVKKRSSFHSLQAAGAFSKLLCINNINGKREYRIKEI